MTLWPGFIAPFHSSIFLMHGEADGDDWLLLGVFVVSEVSDGIALWVLSLDGNFIDLMPETRTEAPRFIWIASHF